MLLALPAQQQQQANNSLDRLMVFCPLIVDDAMPMHASFPLSAWAPWCYQQPSHLIHLPFGSSETLTSLVSQIKPPLADPETKRHHACMDLSHKILGTA